MRFLPHCLIALLAAAPALASGQTASSTQSLPGKDYPPGNAPAEAPPEREGFGCGSQGYTGFVKTGEKALAGASVFVKGTTIVLVTNELGYFVLPPSVVNWPTLSVSAMGYEPVTLTYQACEPLNVGLKVMAGTKFKKHGRKKGWLVPPKSNHKLR